MLTSTQAKAGGSEEGVGVMSRKEGGNGVAKD